VRAAGHRGVIALFFVTAAELWNILTHGLLMRVRPTPRSARVGDIHSLRSGIGSGNKRNVFDPIKQDFRLARRTLFRRPGAALGVILLLAMGIGLNTTMFALVDAYLLQSPYPDAEHLVSVRPFPAGATPAVRATMPEGLPEIDWPTRNALIEDGITWDLDAFTVLGGERPEVVRGAWINPGFFRALRTTPALGRLFVDTDGEPGAAPVAVLSHSLWQRRYGGDPGVVGQTVSAYASDRPDETEAFTVIGVLPSDFWFITTYTEMLVNLTEPRMPYMLRLTAGTSKERVAAHLTGVVRSQVDGIDPDWPGMSVESTLDLHISAVRPVLIALAAAAGFVLLIACGNVALLLTVRAFGRQREIGIRRALGASRMRVVQQLAAEGAILAGTSCITGVAIAWCLLEAFGPLMQEQLRTSVPGGLAELAVNLPVLLLAIVSSAATGFVFTVVPALASTKGDLARSVREGGPASSDTRRRWVTRNIVIAVEVAASLILSVGAALMLRSAIHLHTLDLGFEPRDVITANLLLRQRDYPEGQDLTRFVDRYLTSVRSSPGVEYASMLAGWPFQNRTRGSVNAEGIGDEPGTHATTYVVTDGYFETMGIPITHGRPIGEEDGSESEPVVIVSQSLVTDLYRGTNPVGRRIQLEAEGENAPWRTVIGVAADVRETLTGEVLPDTYLPYAQTPSPFLFVLVRTAGNPTYALSAVQQSLTDIDPTGAVTRIVSMSDLVAGELARPRFLAILLTTFGTLAVLLALTGLYSTIAYAVSQRRRDVAIHIALGARNNAVVSMFVRQAMLVIGIGIVAGVVGSIALTRVLSSQLHGVTSLDAVAYGGTIIVMLAAAAVAAWFPARTAAATDPVTALREE
jgi:putative ABC transport system permease protein